MGIRPTFRITADSEDVTNAIRQRFSSLRITDEAGLKSDVLQLVLTDHDPNQPIVIPDTGAELETWIGYDGVTIKMGLFIVDEVSLNGPPGRMTIRAHASPQTRSTTGRESLQTQKTRSWEKGTTLADMLKTIAGEHGLEPLISSGLAEITLPHTDQVAESDMHLLTRLARNYAALVKPADGKLLMVRRADSTTPDGKILEPVDLRPGEITSWTVNIAKRRTVESVIATYHDTQLAEDKEITAGSGAPTMRLRHTYSDEAEAKQAAVAELERRQRSGQTLDLTLPGRTDVLAEGRVNLRGFRPGVNGEWLLTSVVHEITGSGYMCRVKAEVPGPG